MPASPERHPRILALLAFIFVFWLTLIVTTVVLVGAFDVAPRNAAILALLPATALGGICAAIRPLRRLFAFMLVFG